MRCGRSGNDLLDGGPGADFLDGGPGVDTATYEHSSGGVRVNLGNHDDYIIGFEISTRMRFTGWENEGVAATNGVFIRAADSRSFGDNGLQGQRWSVMVLMARLPAARCMTLMHFICRSGCGAVRPT